MMESWTPLAAPLYATVVKPGNPSIYRILGYGVESGLPVLVMCSPTADWIQAGHANFENSLARYWSRAAHEKLGGLVIHPSAEAAYEVARRKMDAIRKREAAVVAEAEAMLGGVA
jgi:hypothetical protein